MVVAVAVAASSFQPGSCVVVVEALSVPSAATALVVAPSLSTSSSSSSALFMTQETPPQPRMPRRMLKKRGPREGDRKRRRRNHRRHAGFPMAGPIGTIVPPDDVVISAADAGGDGDDPVGARAGRRAAAAAAQEYRPLVASVRREVGEDYWIDPEDMERERRRREEQERQRIAFEARSGDEAMPQEKLMTEVKAPYRQNWIGYFSLGVGALSAIVSQFPELLEPASVTRFPDL